MPLKRALDNNDLDALNAYLAALPQRSKNELFNAAREQFGFKTEEVEAVRYMLAADLAQRLHRHSDTSAIGHLLLRWNWPLVSLRSVGCDTQQTFKQMFGLPKKAAWTLFASWDHFAIACMKNETPMATEIQAYLLDAGVSAAANAIAEHESDHHLESKDKQEFLQVLSADIGIPISELIQVVKGGDPSKQGTWAHPLVMIELAQWCDKRAHVKVTKAIYGWMATGQVPQGGIGVNYIVANMVHPVQKLRNKRIRGTIWNEHDKKAVAVHHMIDFQTAEFHKYHPGFRWPKDFVLDMDR
jgi:hypothetical protein